MNSSIPGLSARFGKALLIFLLILAGYMMSFSWDENDALDTVYWAETGQIRALLEFRHLEQRMLPLWLWQWLNHVGIETGMRAVLDLWDFTTAALSVMLLYCILFELTNSRPISFAGSFAYATAHCVWIYVGSGRLYSTSMLLAFAGYYLALQMGKEISEGRRLVIAFGAATYACFACTFWLVHAFNAIGAGLLLFFLPPAKSFFRRCSYLTVYSLTGIILVGVLAVSCLLYVQIPLERQEIKAWMAAAGTQPMQFDALSPMKASFGQAHGILAIYELPYMINGLMLKDPHLVKMASLPWQLGKFVLVWLLLAPVYLYPLYLMWKGDTRMRILCGALYVPLAINMYFSVGWLGSDVQRFMPSMLSQYVFGALAVQDLLRRVPRPRLLAGMLVACLAFIAADNFVESLLPSQRRYMVLEAEMKTVRPFLKPDDLPVNFGRDASITYLTMTNLYGGARFLNTTNDYTKYAWDRTDWMNYFNEKVKTVESRGGRAFVMDRLALGQNPPEAAWSEKQHPRPSLKQFASFLQNEYCLLPSFQIEGRRYFQLSPRTSGCPASALAPAAENRP
ncbi:MAG: hypothetical protein HY234_02590 [Acidobacteria bacterium]|nr:hypothetical protein [Acidobacteriota bacterium]MBI3661923.1 hypothetical protein [Acidobacteriota bacterium]